MARGAALTDCDKKKIRHKLRKECERSWISHGYKKTNIKDLCSELGIGIGTFYMFYPSKEELFFETLEAIQHSLNNKFFGNILLRNPTKEGFIESIKELFREYCNKPFLYSTNSDDFISFSSKLQEEKLDKLKYDNIDFFRRAIEQAGLTLKVPEDIAFGVLSALLSTIYVKDTLSCICDSLTLFDFMLDNLMKDIFE